MKDGKSIFKGEEKDRKGGEIPRWEGNKQLIKKETGLETGRKSSSSFFFALLLRNLWIICCRGK